MTITNKNWNKNNPVCNDKIINNIKALRLNTELEYASIYAYKTGYISNDVNDFVEAGQGLIDWFNMTDGVNIK